MEGKEEKKQETITQRTIFLYIVMSILFIESIVVIASSIYKGIIKKEILSKSSSIGFDINIIMK